MLWRKRSTASVFQFVLNSGPLKKKGILFFREEGSLHRTVYQEIGKFRQPALDLLQLQLQGTDCSGVPLLKFDLLLAEERMSQRRFLLGKVYRPLRRHWDLCVNPNCPAHPGSENCNCVYQSRCQLVVPLSGENAASRPQ